VGSGNCSQREREREKSEWKENLARNKPVPENPLSTLSHPPQKK
jgi:hypothetical protein